MSTYRHNGYGFPARTSGSARSFNAVVAATAQQLDRQPADAAFGSTPQTNQWSCTCGRTNPARRERCAGCGEVRR